MASRIHPVQLSGLQIEVGQVVPRAIGLHIQKRIELLQFIRASRSGNFRDCLVLQVPRELLDDLVASAVLVQIHQQPITNRLHVPPDCLAVVSFLEPLGRHLCDIRWMVEIVLDGIVSEDKKIGMFSANLVNFLRPEEIAVYQSEKISQSPCFNGDCILVTGNHEQKIRKIDCVVEWSIISLAQSQDP